MGEEGWMMAMHGRHVLGKLLVLPLLLSVPTARAQDLFTFRGSELPTGKIKIVLHGIDFDSNKASIRSAALPVLDEAVQRLRDEDGVVVIGPVQTDSPGNDAFNLALARRRARSVRKYLIAHGIAAQRVIIDGLSDPRAAARTSALQPPAKLLVE
jgi:outer membrane protein OmpA-like peptidoglycan-associated protein